MFSPIPDILQDIRAGKFIVLVDDEDRENEGDLVLAAEFATPERIQQIQKLAGGYLCLSLTESDCDRLGLRSMTTDNTSVRGTPFTVSIDGHPKHGVGTGVSAFDRAKTIAMVLDPASLPEDFVRPGHINPLRSRDGGVLVRTGQTEGSIDLCRLAGLHPSALIIEIVRDDGQMARRPDLEKLCAEHGLKMCSIEQLIAYRLERDSLIRRLDPEQGTPIVTEHGPFNLIAYRSLVDPLPHVVLSLGGVGDLGPLGRVIPASDPVLVRMHRRDLLGDVFGEVTSSPEGSSGSTLRSALRMIQREGRGALVYLRTEGTGHALESRLQSLSATASWGGLVAPTPEPCIVPMHLRTYGIGGQILRDLGLSKLRLLSNHPKSLPGLEAFGLEIVDHVALPFDDS